MFFRAIAEIFRPSLSTDLTVKITNPAEEELKRLAADLDAKREACKERMGEKWLLHPNNHVQKKILPDNTLGFKTV